MGRAGVCGKSAAVAGLQDELTGAFKKTAGGILRGLRESEKAPGAERIYTAGEKEWLAWQERKDKGVPVGDSIQKELVELRDKFGLDYKFPFEA